MANDGGKPEAPRSRSTLLFMGAVAGVLLVLYIYAVGAAIVIAHQTAHPAAGADQPSKQMPLDNESLVLVLASVGGLASALIIAMTTATSPGERFPGGIVPGGTSDADRNTANLMSWLYIGAWLLCGLAMFVACILYNKSAPVELSGSAKAWFATAVASVYTYFGIKPQ